MSHESHCQHLSSMKATGPSRQSPELTGRASWKNLWPRQRQTWQKPATQSHGSSRPPRRSIRHEGPKIAELPREVRTDGTSAPEAVMKRYLFASTVVAGAALGLTGLPCLAMTRSVNCDKGETIQAAIETATTRADRLEILASGTCHEDIVIRRAAVTIDGGGAATIVGRVSVFADNVWLYNLTITITRPGRGVNLGSANARLWSVAPTGNGGGKDFGRHQVPQSGSGTARSPTTTAPG